MPFVRQDLAERLNAKTDKSGDCWLWTAGRQRQGYGKIYVDGATRPAHRVWYEMVKGPVPDGLCLDHLCRNPGCVNPDHLEPVTNAENVRRGASSALKPPREDCRFGHDAPFIDAHGHPRCRVCHNARQREYNARRSTRK